MKRTSGPDDRVRDRAAGRLAWVGSRFSSLKCQKVVVQIVAAPAAVLTTERERRRRSGAKLFAERVVGAGVAHHGRSESAATAAAVHARRLPGVGRTLHPARRSAWDAVLRVSRPLCTRRGPHRTQRRQQSFLQINQRCRERGANSFQLLPQAAGCRQWPAGCRSCLPKVGKSEITSPQRDSLAGVLLKASAQG